MVNVWMQKGLPPQIASIYFVEVKAEAATKRNADRIAMGRKNKQTEEEGISSQENAL